VGLLLELYVLLFGEARCEAVDVSEGAGLEVHVEICGSEVGPHGVEHEAENDRVGGADDVELPADQVVVSLTLLAGPDAVQCGHEEHGTSDRDGEDEDVQRRTQHGCDVLRNDFQAFRIFGGSGSGKFLQQIPPLRGGMAKKKQLR
jgi:hypothetical protein